MSWISLISIILLHLYALAVSHISMISIPNILMIPIPHLLIYMFIFIQTDPIYMPLIILIPMKLIVVVANVPLTISDHLYISLWSKFSDLRSLFLINIHFPILSLTINLFSLFNTIHYFLFIDRAHFFRFLFSPHIFKHLLIFIYLFYIIVISTLYCWAFLFYLISCILDVERLQ